MLTSMESKYILTVLWMCVVWETQGQQDRNPLSITNKNPAIKTAVGKGSFPLAGTTIDITCTANIDSNMEKTTEWRKSGVKISATSSRISIIETRFPGILESNLKIKDISLDDGGDYSCHLLGTDHETHYAFYVVDVVTEDVSLNASTNTSSFNCSVYNWHSFDGPFWFKGDREITIDGTKFEKIVYHLPLLDEGQYKAGSLSRIYIHNTNKEDVGTYRCEVRFKPNEEVVSSAFKVTYENGRASTSTSSCGRSYSSVFLILTLLLFVMVR